ncbi:MAG TPA: DUF6786 family protein [Thermoguttaceae bacterium]|nr:DUF6786 family protein [Thermoguttaceae bacterium]
MQPTVYGQVKQFLAEHTDIVELKNDKQGRLIVCPEYQGRVMTSTVDGDDGMSFGFICYDFIKQGQNDPHFNNYGGEERMWISPEGGPFSLWFEPGMQTQKLEDWYTPKDLNEGPWEVVAADRDTAERDTLVKMQRKMNLQNTSGTKFDVTVTRDVRMLAGRDIAELFDTAVSDILDGDILNGESVKSVAFETINRITNDGDAWTLDDGLISVWMLGMFNSSPQSVTIVPYREGDEAELGTAVRADYFGKLTPERLKVLPGAILFRADGNFRSKLGTTKQRAVDVLGSIDFANEVLTLVKFSMPENPVEEPYMNNLWGNRLDEPYDGDVINAYNDGPNELGTQMGKFYELETLSPAGRLKTGETLTHCNRTVHIRADRATLSRIAKSVLGIDLETVAEEMSIH